MEHFISPTYLQDIQIIRQETYINQIYSLLSVLPKNILVVAARTESPQFQLFRTPVPFGFETPGPSSIFPKKDLDQILAVLQESMATSQDPCNAFQIRGEHNKPLVKIYGGELPSLITTIPKVAAYQGPLAYLAIPI